MQDDYFSPDTYAVIRRDTGEEVPIDIFIKKAKAGYWEKAYAKTLAEYIGLSGSSTNKLLAYLIKNKTADNMILGTVRSISDELNISPGTTNKLFETLKKKCFLKHVRSGCYMLSPGLLRHGSNTRGAMMMRIWHEDEY